MAILLKVVEAGSLSAAAKQLNVPLATVSRRIAELEAHLKTRMLNRSSDEPVITHREFANLLLRRTCVWLSETIEKG